MDRRTFLKSATAAAAVPLSGRVGAEAPRILKFSHVVAPDTPKGQAADFFAKTLERRSQGRFKVEVYANSSLYKDKEELEALQLGAVHFLAPSLSKFGPLGIRQFELFDLPYLFRTESAFEKVTRGPLGAELFGLLEASSVKGLAYWSAGFHVYSANRPVRLPGDLKGLKMRVPPSKVLEASLRTLGALPQVLAFGDVYQALQTGVVDGTENIPSSYTSQRWYEVQKYIALTYHTHTGYAMIMNKSVWDGLAPDLKDAITQSSAEATEYESRLVAEENAKALAQIKASGRTQIAELSDAERDQWRAVMLPVHDQMRDRIGADLLRRVTEATRTS